MDERSGDAGYDEQGVSYDDYPNCEHAGVEPGERCTTCVPTAVRQQRLIDTDPEGYDAAVDAMLAEAERRQDETTWRAEP